MGHLSSSFLGDDAERGVQLVGLNAPRKGSRAPCTDGFVTTAMACGPARYLLEQVSGDIVDCLGEVFRDIEVPQAVMVALLRQVSTEPDAVFDYPEHILVVMLG